MKIRYSERGFGYIEPEVTFDLAEWLDSLTPEEKTRIALRYVAWKYGNTATRLTPE